MAGKLANNKIIQYNKVTNAHTHRFNVYFSGEPGLAGFPLVRRSAEVSLLTGRTSFLSPKQHCQSTKGLTDLQFYRRQNAWPTNSVNALKAKLTNDNDNNNSFCLTNPSFWHCYGLGLFLKVYFQIR